MVSSADAQRREREVRKPSRRGPEVRFKKTESDNPGVECKGRGRGSWLGSTQSAWR